MINTVAPTSRARHTRTFSQKRRRGKLYAISERLFIERLISLSMVVKWTLFVLRLFQVDEIAFRVCEVEPFHARAWAV